MKSRIAGVIALIALAVVSVVSLAAAGPPVEAKKPSLTINVPEYGLCIGGKVERVKDGDTLVFSPDAIFIDVRLLECLAPEVKGAEKPEGLKSAANLRAICEGKHARLWIPASRKVSDITTLSRVLGHVWVDGQREHVSAQQVKAGFAKWADSDGKEASLERRCQCVGCQCVGCNPVRHNCCSKQMAMKEPDGLELLSQ